MNRISSKHRRASILVGFLMFLIMPPTEAATGGRAYYWAQHQKAAAALIRAWVDAAPQDAFEHAVYNLARFEMLLISDHVRLSDPRLVGSILKSPGFAVRSPLDYREFAYRVFEHELQRQTGFHIDPDRLFRSVASQGETQ